MQGGIVGVLFDNFLEFRYGRRVIAFLPSSERQLELEQCTVGSDRSRLPPTNPNRQQEEPHRCSTTAKSFPREFHECSSK
jgi:hypothetical protein